MRAAVCRYVTAGAALVGAGVIAGAPIVPPPDVHLDDSAVRLASDTFDDLANVPMNLFIDVVNIPASELTGIQELADNLIAAGNWWVYTSTNVLGINPPTDPVYAMSVANMLVPFPALSHGLGQQLATILEAELPMNPGCNFIPGYCPELSALLAHMFTVPLQQLYSAEGYTFPEVIDPVTGVPAPWSEEHVSLNAAEPFTDFWNSLTADPATNPIDIPSLQDVGTAFSDLAKGLYIASDPFVDGSYFFQVIADPITPLRELLQPLTMLTMLTPAADLAFDPTPFVLDPAVLADVTQVFDAAPIFDIAPAILSTLMV